MWWYCLLQTIISQQHDAVFGDLVNFISSSHKKLQSLYDSSKKNKKRPLMLGIPTAVLLTGVNMPGHSELFERLKKAIHQNTSPYVVQLNPSDCSSGVVHNYHSITHVLVCSYLTQE